MLVRSSVTILERDRDTQRDIERQRHIETENERTNEFFINEGKGISTIYFFFHPALGQKTKTTTATKQSKTK